MATPESMPAEPRPTRAEVVEAFKALAEQGYSDPYQLPPRDPEVKLAREAYDTWWLNSMDTARASRTKGAEEELFFARATIYFEAGFLDPTYLEQKVIPWLKDDEKEVADKGLTELALRIHAKTDEIRAVLDS